MRVIDVVGLDAELLFEGVLRPLTSQSSQCFFGRAAALDHGADDLVEHIEQPLLLLGQRQRHLLLEALERLERLLLDVFQRDLTAEPGVDVALQSHRPAARSSSAIGISITLAR